MVNDRATAFRDFCTFMLGTEPSKPIAVDGSLINGALGNFLLDAFRCCYPAEPAPRLPGAAPAVPHDPLGVRQ